MSRRRVGMLDIAQLTPSIRGSSRSLLSAQQRLHPRETDAGVLDSADRSEQTAHHAGALGNSYRQQPGLGAGKNRRAATRLPDRRSAMRAPVRPSGENYAQGIGGCFLCQSVAF